MELYRGDNKSFTLSFTDAVGDPIDITGWKIYFTMKKSLTQSDAEADLKEDTEEHDDPENGLTSIHLSNGQTDTLGSSELPTDYFYDIQVKKTDGSVLTVISGIIKVLADVTRRED